MVSPCIYAPRDRGRAAAACCHKHQQQPMCTSNDRNCPTGSKPYIHIHVCHTYVIAKDRRTRTVPRRRRSPTPETTSSMICAASCVARCCRRQRRGRAWVVVIVVVHTPNAPDSQAGSSSFCPVQKKKNSLVQDTLQHLRRECHDDVGKPFVVREVGFDGQWDHSNDSSQLCTPSRRRTIRVAQSSACEWIAQAMRCICNRTCDHGDPSLYCTSTATLFFYERCL